MTRKKKHHCLDKLKTDTARTKLEIERIKLKTLAYELKLVANKKRYLAEDAEHKKTMAFMEAKDSMVQEMVEDLVTKLNQAREENHKLRTSHL